MSIRRSKAGIGAAAAVAVVLAASCVTIDGGDTSTDTTLGRTVATSAGAVAQAKESPPKTLPGSGFAAPLSLEGVALKLTEVAKVDQPTSFTTRPGYPNYFITERTGHVRQLTVDRAFDNEGRQIRNGLYIERGYVLDIAREVSTDGDRGMYGLAFSSDGRTLFASFTDRDGRLRVSSWRTGDYSVDYSTRKDLLTIDHPRNDRDGNSLKMGADGFLYVSTGDGGGDGDPDGNAQNPKSLLGKILRIDPGGGLGNFPYGFPDTNPFRVGDQGAPEVWAFGLANPRGFTFDRITNDLWIADSAGKDLEEVNELPATRGPGSAGRGANLGWNAMLGTRPAAGGGSGSIPPVFEYDHTDGRCGIVGGVLYRGLANLGLAGAYIYGDECTGQIYGLITDQGVVKDNRPLGIGVAGGKLGGFGESEDGELWVLSLDGQVYRVDPA